MNTQEKDVKQYANWVMNDCMNPQKEIEWLVSTILNSDICRAPAGALQISLKK